VTAPSWAEGESVETLAGGLLAMASLSGYRPESAGRMRAELLAKIGDRERDLIRKLAEEMTP
jgi:hypothetical protein